MEIGAPTSSNQERNTPARTSPGWMVVYVLLGWLLVSPILLVAGFFLAINVYNIGYVAALKIFGPWVLAFFVASLFLNVVAFKKRTRALALLSPASILLGSYFIMSVVAIIISLF